MVAAWRLLLAHWSHSALLRLCHRARHVSLAKEKDVAIEPGVETVTNAIKAAFVKKRSAQRVVYLVRRHCRKQGYITTQLTWLSMVQKNMMGMILSTALSGRGFGENDTVKALLLALMKLRVSGMLPLIDTVSLTDLATFIMRGCALTHGELALQQRLGSYLVDSVFSLMLEGSELLSWFACVHTPLRHAWAMCTPCRRHSVGSVVVPRCICVCVVTHTGTRKRDTS